MLLKTVTRTQGNNKALKDGTVKPKSFEFQFIEVDPLHRRGAVERLDDVAERDLRHTLILSWRRQSGRRCNNPSETRR